MIYDDSDEKSERMPVPEMRLYMDSEDTRQTETMPTLPSGEMGHSRLERTESWTSETIGTIYILETKNRRLVKIGYTRRALSMRLQQHQYFIQKMGGDLRIIGFFPGTRRTETRLHQLFADCRFRTEWYHHEPALTKLASLFDEPMIEQMPLQEPNEAAQVAQAMVAMRNQKLSPERRKEIAFKAAQTRWKNAGKKRKAAAKKSK